MIGDDFTLERIRDVAAYLLKELCGDGPERWKDEHLGHYKERLRRWLEVESNFFRYANACLSHIDPKEAEQNRVVFTVRYDDWKAVLQ